MAALVAIYCYLVNLLGKAMIYLLPWEEIKNESWGVRDTSSRIIVARVDLTKSGKWLGKVLAQKVFQSGTMTISYTLYRFSVSDDDRATVQSLVNEALTRYGYEFIDSKLINLI